MTMICYLDYETCHNDRLNGRFSEDEIPNQFFRLAENRTSVAVQPEFRSYPFQIVLCRLRVFRSHWKNATGLTDP